jgi:hypothetical protein
VRPLDETYAAIFIGAIVVKVGLWAGTGGEGAKFWMSRELLSQLIRRWQQAAYDEPS